jgi:hypothetical protein
MADLNRGLQNPHIIKSKESSPLSADTSDEHEYNLLNILFVS